ncbi:MAG: HEAT repeat domain-containing protein [Vulcanimicrobiota bacterium]
MRKHRRFNLSLTIASLAIILFSTISNAHGSTYYYLDLTCDLFPFIPFWALLLAVWPIMLIIISRDLTSIIKASSVIVVMITMVIAVPYMYQVSLILFSFLSLYFLIDYVLLWKSKHHMKLLRMESILLLAALSSAILITLIYHSPPVLVYRLRSSSTFLVEEWIKRGGKEFDEPLRKALLDKDTADRLKVLHLLMERKNAITLADLHTILSRRNEDRKLTLTVIDYLREIRSRESLPLLVTILAEEESSSLSSASRDTALIESLYDAIESIDRDEALALLNEKLSSQKKLLPFVALNLNQTLYAGENYRKIPARISPEALLTLLSRSSVSDKELRKDILTELAAHRCSDIIIKALEDIQKKDDRDNIPLLIAMLKDNDAAVRSTANWALINMSEENFDFDAEAALNEREKAVHQWEEWYERQCR